MNFFFILQFYSIYNFFNVSQTHSLAPLALVMVGATWRGQVHGSVSMSILCAPLLRRTPTPAWSFCTDKIQRSTPIRRAAYPIKRGAHAPAGNLLGHLLPPWKAATGPFLNLTTLTPTTYTPGGTPPFQWNTGDLCFLVPTHVYMMAQIRSVAVIGRGTAAAEGWQALRADAHSPPNPHSPSAWARLPPSGPDS